jgi:lysylphosphatidylglycerol synthetase-like protein (DUF2156 family)
MSRLSPNLPSAERIDPLLDRRVAQLAAHADNHSAFLAVNQGTEYFQIPTVDGFIAYRRSGRLRVQFGGVTAAPAHRDRLLRAFLADTWASGHRAMAVQLTPADIGTFHRHGYRINQLGSSYALDLERQSLAGKHFVQLRNKISRARRAGVCVREIGVDAPLSPELADRLAVLDRQWLDTKGSHELAFLIGERNGPADGFRRLLVAERDGLPQGYISFSPVYGSRPGWLQDLTRRSPDAPPGVMELILAEMIDRLRHEAGAEPPGWLHFGFTPFVGLAEQHRVPGGSATVDTVIDLLARRGARLYPAADQVAYKLKWRPQSVEPDYLAFHGRPSIAAVWRLLRLTRVI